MPPADLHAFWRRTTETLQQTPICATRTDAAAQSGREYVTSLVQMDSFEGKRLRAWYTVPKDPVPGGRLPAVLVVPGYGGDKPIPTYLAISGFAVLTLYPRGQGESCQEWTLEHSTKLTYHVTDKERCQHTTQPRVPIIVKLLALLVVAVSLLAYPMAPRGLSAPATTAPRQASVQWAGADVTLTGEVFLPTSRDQPPPRSPAIVLLHGCGGLYTQRGQLTGRHREWAQHFAAWGFVALLVDSLGPRGLGPLCTLKDRPIHPWKERTLDAYAALEYLAARADVDRTNIFVMGWSHGGSTVTGVVREEAPGRRVDGPRFKAAIAYYPGCERPLRAQHYRLTVPLLIQHGTADDWAPAAPCVALAAKLQRLGMPVETILYPEAHHGFDAPNSPLRVLPDVYNPKAPGERGAHVGTHERARLQAIADTKRFLDQQLAR